MDAAVVFEQRLLALLPFVPVLAGGAQEPVVRQALSLLRADERLQELETLLALFASFVLDTRLVAQIVRWDMTVLRESPWYQEILEEGLQQGLEQGMERGREEGLRLGAQRQLLRVLDRRFGAVPPALHAQLEGLELAQLETLIDAALDAASLDEFLDHLPR